PLPLRALHSFPTRRSSDLLCEKLTSVFGAIDAGGFNRRIKEACVFQLLEIHVAIECAGNTSNPKLDTALNVRWNLTLRHYVRNRDRKSTRLNSSHDQISYA